jgi:GrpB-like predicted nucleotidyltransferase (UPF0157 family)
MASANPIEIVDYDPHWPTALGELSAVIAAALGALAVAIEHVGSTAVPGLPAKPILDFDVVIESSEHLPVVTETLAGLGYVHQGNLGIAGREAFARQGDDVPRCGTGRSWPEHHLYVCPRDSAELHRHLAFRDALRADPAQAAAYGQLKRRLAQRFRDDRDAYGNGKAQFVEGVLKQVLGREGV